MVVRYCQSLCWMRSRNRATRTLPKVPILNLILAPLLRTCPYRYLFAASLRYYIYIYINDSLLSSCPHCPHPLIVASSLSRVYIYIKKPASSQELASSALSTPAYSYYIDYQLQLVAHSYTPTIPIVQKSIFEGANFDKDLILYGMVEDSGGRAITGLRGGHGVFFYRIRAFFYQIR